MERKAEIIWHPFPHEKPKARRNCNHVYLITYRLDIEGTTETGVATANYNGREWWFHYCKVKDVIAWAKLPEPYRED